MSATICSTSSSLARMLVLKAERFNTCSASPLGVLGLNTALELLHEVGMPAISERILDLTDMLIGDLRERGYRIRWPLAHRHRSGSVIVDLPDPQRANERLRAAHVIAAQLPALLAPLLQLRR